MNIYESFSVLVHCTFFESNINGKISTSVLGDLPDSIAKLQKYFGNGSKSNDVTNVFYNVLGNKQGSVLYTFVIAAVFPVHTVHRNALD